LGITPLGRHADGERIWLANAGHRDGGLDGADLKEHRAIQRAHGLGLKAVVGAVQPRISYRGIESRLG
jgi:hypothetical protein